MKQEIMKNGPLESGFAVFEDFYYYSSGIYSYTYGPYIAGHSVRIVGWGQSNGT
jgi:cathepsin B